jgi:hypothetical protein
MKSSFSLGLLVAALFSAPVLPARVSSVDDATPPPLQVVVQAHDPIKFRQYRHGLADGKELILSTLKLAADQQAQFAGYPGDVVVLDEETEPAADAPVLRLIWTEDEAVAAELVTPGTKPRYLGIVSRSPLSEHPDYRAMEQEIDRSGSSDRKRDASVRAHTRLHLYLALLRAKREMRN